ARSRPPSRAWRSARWAAGWWRATSRRWRRVRRRRSAARPRAVTASAAGPGSAGSATRARISTVATPRPVSADAAADREAEELEAEGRVEAGQEVVRDDPEAAGQALQVVDRVRLPDVQEPEQEEGAEHPAELPGQPDGRDQHAGHLVHPDTRGIEAAEIRLLPSRRPDAGDRHDQESAEERDGGGSDGPDQEGDGKAGDGPRGEGSVTQPAGR